MAVIDHITTNNSVTYEVQDTVARTKANNLESANYTDIGGFADGNTFLVKTDDGMKKGYLNNFANWILDKLTTKVYNQLATSNKTMIGALNELYSKRLCMQQVYRNGVWNDCNNIPIGETAMVFSSAKNKPLGNTTWFIFCMGSER